MLTQDEIIHLLSDQSIFITKRQLSYWRKLNELPKLLKYGNQYGYEEDILKKIKNLCISKGLYHSDILCQIYVEGNIFDVYRIELFRVGNYNNKIMYTNKGIMISRKER